MSVYDSCENLKTQMYYHVQVLRVTSEANMWWPRVTRCHLPLQRPECEERLCTETLYENLNKYTSGKTWRERLPNTDAIQISQKERIYLEWIVSAW